MNRSSGPPIASTALQPNIFSAAPLNSTIRWSASTERIASIADRTIASRRASPSRIAWCARRISRSAVRRSVMSRRITVSRFCPPTVAWEIEASIGNSVPSERSAHSAVCIPICRDVSPVRLKCSTWAWCPAQNRSGMNRSSGAPIACAALHPNIFSAAALNSTMR